MDAESLAAARRQEGFQGGCSLGREMSNDEGSDALQIRSVFQGADCKACIAAEAFSAVIKSQPHNCLTAEMGAQGNHDMAVSSEQIPSEL